MIYQPTAQPVEFTALTKAVGLSIILHLAILFFIVFPSNPPTKVIPLASMIFDYDPLGGEPGGGEIGGGESAPSAEAASESAPEAPQAAAPPVEEVTEPIPEPEPEVAEAAEDLSVIKTVAPEAAEVQAPPPAPAEEKPKPKPRARPRPAAPAVTQPKGSTDPANGLTSGAGTGTGSGLGTGPGTGGGEGTGQGGYGGGTGRGTRDALAGYQAQIRRKLVRYRKYPPSARREGLEGVATMAFTLNREGRVVSARLISSSGHPILDDEAQALIQRVNPLPPFPKELNQNTLDITVPIQFALR
jgi:protein TonB